MFAVDQVGLIAKKMEDRVLKERLRFEKIYDLIEEYITKVRKNVILE